jgi:tetratricopeptide (TPR) repeat protein
MEEKTNTDQFRALELKPNFKWFPFNNLKQPIIVLVFFGILFNWTSLNNEYALDDGIVIHQNENVLKGVAGIKNILTKDAFDSFYRRMCASDQLEYGRYRPLSIVSFAIEQQFIHVYRTGLYMKVEDCNKNGILDKEKTFYTTPCGKPESNYEYNEFTDQNKDGIAQGQECYACWDLNKNFHNDSDEDLNKDGVFNEIDCQVYGAGFRHFNNIIAYILASIFLYVVFRKYMFKDQQDLAFLAAFIFLIHPIHSEVVAVVCRRDEIFSLLFIALTFLFSFKYMEHKKPGSLIATASALLLALLSKEYAVVMLVLIPIAMFVFNKIKFDLPVLLPVTLIVIIISAMLIFIKEKTAISQTVPFLTIFFSAFAIYVFTMRLSFKRALMQRGPGSLMIWLYGAFIIYLGLRVNAVNTIITGLPQHEILNDPYIFAKGEERFCTKIFVLLKYLVLLCFPHPLISDYSYDSIAYRHFGDWDFIASLLLHLVLLVFGIRLTLKRHILGFAIITYFLFLSVISNIFFETHININEHFIFHASIGFATAVAWVILAGLEKISSINLFARKVILFGGLAVILFLFGCKTWERNHDWKNDVTLFLKDVHNAPNSVLILGNAGARWIDLADTKEITANNSDRNMSDFNDYNGTLKISDEDLKQGGYKSKREAALYKGIAFLKHAVELHPRYVNGYLNLGLAHFKLQKDVETLFYWKMAEHLYPNNPYLRNYYTVYDNTLKARGTAYFNKGRMDSAAIMYKYGTILDPNNPDGWYNLGGVYFNLKKYKMAKQCWQRVLKIKPDFDKVIKAMESLPAEGKF